jgi:uncharacterized lipoprotein YmbA
MKYPWIICVALSAGLFGCSAAPVHYHTLVAPAKRADRTAQRAPFVLDVQPVGIPSQLDQADLVVRRGESGIDVLDSERWASPLASELRVALSMELARRLVTYDIAGLSSSAERPVIRVNVQVRRFDAWPGKTVQLEADWRLIFADKGMEALTCSTRLARSAPPDYDGLVLAQQSMLQDFADVIGNDIVTATQSGRFECVPASASG